MPRKSTRNAAKSTPEPRIETRKSTRSSSRRRKSPPKEVEIEPVETVETQNTNENCDKTVEIEQANEKVDDVNTTEESVKTENAIINEGSHTPPHCGSVDKEASDNDEDDADKGKFKGIINSQVEENSEIKMNSVIIVSAEESTKQCSSEELVIPQSNDSDNLQNSKQNADSDLAENANDNIADSQETKISDSENDNEPKTEQINGKNNATDMVKNADEDQTEEGEITESKSDEEDKNEKNVDVKVKSPVKVKLRRDSFFESTHELQLKKMKWNPEEHQCLKIELSDLQKVAIDDFKALASDLKLAAEEEIKLEETYKPKAIVERISTSRTSVDSERITDVNEENQEDSNIIALNRKISIVDDAASKLKPPPSPAKQPVSSILFITNLVRPFTLKQLKELLERTGRIKEDGFWTDRIKSKCYVSYESVEEAEATRNALHGVNWPIGNGKKLIIDYATEEDMEKAKNPPIQAAPAPQPPPPQAASPPKIPLKETENTIQEIRNGEGREERKRKISEKEREKSRPAPTREWDIGKNTPRERSRSRSRERRRKHGRRSVTPLEDFIARKQRKIEETVPQKLMDDLFQRTRTMPCVYWQPLSPEEISIKQQQRLTRMEEHKRRLEENSRNRGQREPGRGAYRRRYD